MKTTQMVRIAGFCATTNHGAPITTDKAVRVTVHTVDGDSIGLADTTWLARSLCEDLTVSKYQHRDGSVEFEVTASVPAWWVRKLDTRPAWVRRGDARAPSPVGL